MAPERNHRRGVVAQCHHRVVHLRSGNPNNFVDTSLVFLQEKLVNIVLLTILDEYFQNGTFPLSVDAHLRIPLPEI